MVKQDLFRLAIGFAESVSPLSEADEGWVKRVGALLGPLLPKDDVQDDEPAQEVRLRHLQVQLRPLWIVPAHETGKILN
jgi:hypothetical protein